MFDAVDLCRLCELVSVEAGDGERGEGEEEGGERVGGGTREEEVSRVACLSALVPCLSADPSLHHIARAGQLEHTLPATPAAVQLQCTFM